MSMQITGTVHHIGGIETVGKSGFTKRLLVVQTAEKYDNTVPIEFVKDKVALLDGLRVGQSVTVDVNVGGREWQGRYFPSVRGWKVTASGQSVAAPVAVAQVQDEDGDSLPF